MSLRRSRMAVTTSGLGAKKSSITSRLFGGWGGVGWGEGGGGGMQQLTEREQERQLQLQNALYLMSSVLTYLCSYHNQQSFTKFFTHLLYLFLSNYRCYERSACLSVLTDGSVCACTLPRLTITSLSSLSGLLLLVHVTLRQSLEISFVQVVASLLIPPL